MFRLLDFPLELITQVLIKLPARDVVNCLTVCKALQLIICESSELELIIKLGEHGLRLRNFPSSDNWSSSDKRLTAAIDKVEQFKNWEDGWTNLTPFRTAETIPVKTNYHLTEGILGLGIKTLSAPENDDSLRGIGFYKLWVNEGRHPLNLWENQECEMWIRHENVGLRIMDFSYDPTQDLMILVELATDGRLPKRIILRTMSTNEPHPRARNSILESEDPEYWSQCDIRIYDDIVSVLFFANDQWDPNLGRLTIWKWTTGEVLLNRVGIGGYAILKPNILLTLELGLEEERRHQDPQDEEDDDENDDDNDASELKPQLHISHMPSTSEGSEENVPDIIFGFPLRHRPVSAYLFSETPLRDAPGLPNGLNISPYMNDETAETIIVLSLRYQEKHHVFISVQHLIRKFNESIAAISALRSSEQAAAKPSTSATLPASNSTAELWKPLYFHPWHSWGPDATRWLPLDLIFSGYGCIRGARFCALDGYAQLFPVENGVIQQPEENPTGSGQLPQTYILMMDFNPRQVKIALRDKESGLEAEGMKERMEQMRRDIEREMSELPAAWPIEEKEPMLPAHSTFMASEATHLDPSHPIFNVIQTSTVSEEDGIAIHDDGDTNWSDIENANTNDNVHEVNASAHLSSVEAETPSDPEEENDDDAMLNAMFMPNWLSSAADPRIYMSKIPITGEWKWQKNIFKGGEVTCRLPFLLLQTMDTTSCLVIMGMDHLVTSSVILLTIFEKFPDDEGLAKHQIYQFRNV